METQQMMELLLARMNASINEHMQEMAARMEANQEHMQDMLARTDTNRETDCKALKEIQAK
jgi:roadblock/LC7 domain-containing protein